MTQIKNDSGDERTTRALALVFLLFLIGGAAVIGIILDPLRLAFYALIIAVFAVTAGIAMSLILYLLNIANWKADQSDTKD